MLHDYPVLAHTVVALAATSWRLQKIIKKSRLPTPRMGAPLSTEEFCDALRVPDAGPQGVRGYLWYPGPPAELDKIKAEDSVALDKIAAVGLDAESAERAVIDAARKIVAAYQAAAGKIRAMLETEAALVAEIEQWPAKRVVLPRPATWQLSYPAEKLGDGRLRALGRAICLPPPGGRGDFIWSPAAAPPSPRGMRMMGP